MTKEALEKLNEKQMNYCKTLSAIISIDRTKGAKADYERTCGKLRGFLECLMQMGTLTVSEMKALYLWFFTEDRSERKKESSAIERTRCQRCQNYQPDEPEAGLREGCVADELYSDEDGQEIIPEVNDEITGYMWELGEGCPYFIENT